MSEFLTCICHQELEDSLLFLHYEPEAQDLGLWFWYRIFSVMTGCCNIYGFAFSRPVIDGQHCAPELLQCHASYNFRNPCCLCAVDYKQMTYVHGA